MKTKTVILLFLLFIGVGYLIARPDIAPVEIESPAMTGNVADLVSISIIPGETLSGGEEITGSLKNGYFFEANAVGSIRGIDGVVLKQFPITATSDWMTADAISFSFVLDRNGVPSGPGFIRITNDNPSGDPENEKYVEIPVIFE